ncbi:Zinc finger BED domain-containing protein 1 [Merluccius polli]|uniref:Zinc finger BED domain-containing protein 1 n=1 Tax=Merluccius polli TaxID=89951 RepID=A0AA47NXT8_MERPO|nr:Zinc finger BED domain-containing protein 1 [Merluccius polli]
MQPISIVDSEGFKKMLHAFDKHYALPSRHYFSRVVLPNIRTSEPYISLTVHFIDAEFNLKVKCLQTAFMPEDHTGQNIAHGLREALAEWGLNEGQLVCITTDNAANIKLAAEINGWLRLQCFGHRLHLAIENAMKDPRISRAMGVCKRLRALEEVQKQLNLPEHSLKTEFPTRWGSREAMIDRVLEQQKAIAQVLSNDRKLRHLILSWQDIDVLEAVNKSLSPLVEFTDALSGEKYVSVSLVKPTLHLFNNSILEDKEDDTQLSKTIKHDILEYLNEKYSDQVTQELLDMASALDPRFKLKYADEDIKESIVERLKVEMRDVKTASAMERAPLETAAQAAGTEDADPCKKRKKGLGSFFKVTTDKAAGYPPQEDQVIALEIQSYLQVETLDPEKDPLTWWRDAKAIYPRLSKLARKYLCIPATSSSSERVFSTSGHIVSCLRSSLKPDHVNRLVFLAKNL